MRQEVISSPTAHNGPVQEGLVLLPPPTAVQMPFNHNPAAIYLASLRPSGRRSMQHHLNTITDLARPDLLKKTSKRSKVSNNWGKGKFQVYHKSRKTPSFSYGDISDPASSLKAGYKLLPSLH